MESLGVVSKSMADLGSITQQNMALAQQTDSAASELQALGNKLTEVLSAFKLPSGKRPARGELQPPRTSSAPSPRPRLAAEHPKSVSAAASGSAEVTFF
jgi:hypothetical protein